MIEMPREDDIKERKEDRKKYLTTLYNKDKRQIDNYNRLMNELNSHEINSQKLFLYFIQEGKCLYSGNPLNIDDLDLYEIDHIIPRTLIKDDSIDNKALVYRECNQVKAASYVLPLHYRNYKNISWWEKLRKIGLMSSKKFYSLTRKEYKQDDIDGFINRQLVETRQITKHVANILSNYYRTSNIIYLKANLSHNYRERYELFKFRDINDYHHAHDAYLAIVLGEYKEKYMKKEINFDMVKELNNRLRNSNNYEYLKYGYVINSLDDEASGIVNDISKNLTDEKTGEVLFNAKEFNENVKNTLYRNDILISRKVEIRSGQFFKQTIYPKKVGKIKIKDNMPICLYGGYLNIETSYLCLVQYKNKQKIIGIPIDIHQKSLKDINVKNNYIKEHLKLKDNENFKILKNKIPFETEILYNNQNVYIKGYSSASKNNEVSNAHQLKIKKKDLNKWKYALQYILNNKKQYIDEANKYSDEIIEYLLNIKKEFTLFENEVNRIKNNLDYKKIELDDKKKTIIELFKLYHCNSTNANLSKYGLGDRIGRLSGKSITTGVIITKSTTGLKEKKYEF